MRLWLQKLALAGTILVLVLVIVLPAIHIMEPGEHVSTSNASVRAYLAMFPALKNDNPQALLTSVITAPDGSTIMAPAKKVAVQGYVVGTTVRVIYLGGRDDAKFSSLDIFLYKSGVLVLHEIYPKPALNEEYTFPNTGNPGFDRIIVVGTFNDGSRQVLLTSSTQ